MAAATCCSRTPSSSAMRKLIGFIDPERSAGGQYITRGVVLTYENRSKPISGQIPPGAAAAAFCHGGAATIRRLHPVSPSPTFAHSLSPLEGRGFEPSVPGQEIKP